MRKKKEYLFKIMKKYMKIQSISKCGIELRLKNIKHSISVHAI